MRGCEPAAGGAIASGALTAAAAQACPLLLPCDLEPLLSLSAAELKLYLVVGREKQASRTGGAQLGVRKLAGMLGIGAGWVCRAVRRLSEAGLIQVEAGPGRRNCFRLPDRSSAVSHTDAPSRNTFLEQSVAHNVTETRRSRGLGDHDVRRQTPQKNEARPASRAGDFSDCPHSTTETP